MLPRQNDHIASGDHTGLSRKYLNRDDDDADFGGLPVWQENHNQKRLRWQAREMSVLWRIRAPAWQAGSPAGLEDRANPEAKVQVQCQCGAEVFREGEVHGEKSRLSKMRSTSAVPGSVNTAKSATANTASSGKSRPPDASAATPAKPDTLIRLFEEVGLGVGEGPHQCPKCKQDIQAESVICIKCGYDIESGRQLHTKSWVRDESAIGKKPISHVARILAQMPEKVRNLYRSLFRLSLFYLFTLLALGSIVIYQQTIPGAKTLIPLGILAGLMALVSALGIGCYFAGRLVLQHNRMGLSLGLILSILSVPVIPLGPLGIMSALSIEAKRYFR